MAQTVTAEQLEENDIIEVRRLGWAVVVMVHHIEHDGDRVRFRYVDEGDNLTGSVDAAADDSFHWWGR